MSLLLGLDFEATDKDQKVARPIEVGLVLFDSVKNEIVEEYEDFIWRDDYPVVSDEITELTGIKNETVESQGISWEDATNAIHDMGSRADYLVAHNVDYDRYVYGYECKRVGVEPVKFKWVDSWKDIIWPKKMRCRRLVHMAVDAGMKVDDLDTHRATTDVKLMFSLVEQCGMSWEAILEYWEKPKAIISIDIPGPWVDNGVGRDTAKAANFHWCSNNLDKKWSKKILLEELDEVKLAMEPYPINVERNA